MQQTGCSKSPWLVRHMCRVWCYPLTVLVEKHNDRSLLECNYCQQGCPGLGDTTHFLIPPQSTPAQQCQAVMPVLS